MNYSNQDPNMMREVAGRVGIQSELDALEGRRFPRIFFEPNAWRYYAAARAGFFRGLVVLVETDSAISF